MSEQEVEPRTPRRRFVWSQWEDTGFPERVNHAVTSIHDEEQGRRWMFAIGGFQGRGKPVVTGNEEWNDLGEVPLDVHELDVGERDNVCVSIGLRILCVWSDNGCPLDTRQWTKLYPQPPSEEEQAFPATSASSPHRSKDPLYGRYAHSCCWYNGKLYLYGGRNDIQFCEGIDCYDIGESTAKFRIKCTI